MQDNDNRKREVGDARQQDRTIALKGATIETGRGKPDQRCLIANISAEGAELKLDGGVRVPPRFVLNVPHEETAYRAEVRWRDEGRVGVVFNGSERRPRTGPKVITG